MGDSLGIAFSSAVEWVIKRKRRRTPNHRDAVFFNGCKRWLEVAIPSKLRSGKG